jgi:hypothetical protein
VFLPGAENIRGPISGVLAGVLHQVAPLLKSRRFSNHNGNAMSRIANAETMLLYALASTLGHFRFSAPTAVRIEGWFQLVGFIAGGWLTPDDLDELIECLHKRIDYVTPRLRFEFQDEEVCVPYAPPMRPRLCFPPEPITRELEALQKHYRAVSHTGASIYHNLLNIIGDSWSTRQLLLEALARAQDVSSSQVAECWKLLVNSGLGSDVTAEHLQSWIADFQKDFDRGREWGGAAGNVFGLEYHDGLMYVSGAGEECSCPQQAFVDEMRRLLDSYIEAL